MVKILTLSISLRRQILRGSRTTSLKSYDNMVPGRKSCFNELIDRRLASETVLFDQVPYCRSLA